MSVLTRWKPRKVYCTVQADHGDQPGTEHVVKFRQGKPGTAAVISEVVATQLLAAGGVPVLDGRLIDASPGFAASYLGKMDVSYSIVAGLHYGTVLRHDVENGPPTAIGDLDDPEEVLDLWVFDSWLCTTDRILEGNVLMTPVSSTKVRLIAADQSDCFGGAGRLADGSWKKVLAERGAAESVSFLQRVIFEVGGVSAIKAAIAKVRMAAGQMRQAMGSVPPAWLQAAGVDPGELTTALDARQRRLEDILNIKNWEGLTDDLKGGQLL
jgi:hypothetical protein